MCRIKFTTTLDEDLLNKARTKAHNDGLDGVNAIIEKALRLYFANSDVEVWEKTLKTGLLEKMVIRPTKEKIFLEVISKRNISNTYNPEVYNQEILHKNGWHKVWHMNT